ncbi:unnamed protein product [Diamesa hyperborea]
MQKELALMEENTRKTVRQRKILEEEMTKKTIEEMKGTLKSQKLLADKRSELECKRSKLNNLNEKLEQRKNSMRLKLEKRDKMKKNLSNLKVDSQIEELNNLKNNLDETKRSLNFIDLVCKENDMKINDKSQEVHETKMHLESIKEEIGEKKRVTDVLETRIKHEKIIVLQCIQTTMKKEWEKVEQANLNIASDMKVLMKKKDEHDMLMQLMAEKSLSLDCEREKVTKQQALILMEIEEQRRKVTDIPVKNSAIDQEIDELKEKIKAAKGRKEEEDRIYKETEADFENAVKGLIEKQKDFLGTESGNIEENSMSQSSEILQIEKVDINLMSPASNPFSPNAPSARVMKLQAKQKKTLSKKP